MAAPTPKPPPTEADILSGKLGFYYAYATAALLGVSHLSSHLIVASSFPHRFILYQKNHKTFMPMMNVALGVMPLARGEQQKHPQGIDNDAHSFE